VDGEGWWHEIAVDCCPPDPTIVVSKTKTAQEQCVQEIRGSVLFVQQNPISRCVPRNIFFGSSKSMTTLGSLGRPCYPSRARSAKACSSLSCCRCFKLFNSTIELWCPISSCHFFSWNCLFGPAKDGVELEVLHNYSHVSPPS
jgi:hypothetical protein